MFTLYTIGHSDLTAQEFVTRLKAHNITTLVDVRSDPVSRHVPHFNKAALEKWLGEQGITYRFAGAYLGGRPADPALYRDGTLDALKVMRTENYVMGITRLLNLTAQGERVAVMCAEGDPRQCHRHHLIARSLLDPTCSVIEGDLEINVQHIARDGSLEVPLDKKSF